MAACAFVWKEDTTSSTMNDYDVVCIRTTVDNDIIGSYSAEFASRILL